jgi:hypothetical protein
LLNLHGGIPEFIFITDGQYHDSNALDEIEPEGNAIYLLDKAYVDFEALYQDVYSIKNIFKRIIFTKRFFRHPQRSLFNFGVNLFYRYHIRHGISPMII